MPKVRYAIWYKQDGLWHVCPPWYPPNVTLTFTEQAAMQKWAQGERVMLKQRWVS